MFLFNGGQIFYIDDITIYNHRNVVLKIHKFLIGKLYIHVLKTHLNITDILIKREIREVKITSNRQTPFNLASNKYIGGISQEVISFKKFVY